MFMAIKVVVGGEGWIRNGKIVEPWDGQTNPCQTSDFPHWVGTRNPPLPLRIEYHVGGVSSMESCIKSVIFRCSGSEGEQE